MNLLLGLFALGLDVPPGPLYKPGLRAQNIGRNYMANLRSAKKRIRRTARQAVVNRARLGTVRTSIKKVEQAILSGDAAAAKTAFQDAQPNIVRGAQKGIMHRNKASRTLSRLSARIKALKA